MGRGAELAQIEEWSLGDSQKLRRNPLITVWGLAGVGKSQLISEFVKRHQATHPEDNIFWLAGESKEAFVQSIMSFLKAKPSHLGVYPEARDNYHEQRTMIVQSFFSELKDPTRAHARWIIVIDGISSVSSQQQYIKDCVDSLLPHGLIILTTRNKESVLPFYENIEVKGLCEDDALQLLRLEVNAPLKGGDQGMMSVFSRRR